MILRKDGDTEEKLDEMEILLDQQDNCCKINCKELIILGWAPFYNQVSVS